jgi:hypothetical protein
MKGVLLGLLMLAGCSADKVEQRYAARREAVDPSELWLAESLGPVGATVGGRVYVCANIGMREGFSRANVVADERPCLVEGQPATGPGSYVARCSIGYSRFMLNVHSTGDPRNDLTVRLSLQPLDRPGAPTVEVRRYRRIGVCPTGWGVGDQAKPGEAPHANALAVS